MEEGRGVLNAKKEYIRSTNIELYAIACPFLLLGALNIFNIFALM